MPWVILLVVVVFFFFEEKNIAAALNPNPNPTNPNASAVGSYKPPSDPLNYSNPYSLGISVALHPSYVNQQLTGVSAATFQTFGDQNDFARLMSNTHACQTGNEAACEAVSEQAPDMQCDSSFCDQDPSTNNGHGSATDLGNGTFRYNYRSNIGLIGHYGKKVPVGGCYTTGRKWDKGGASNAQSNIAGGYCAGLKTSP